MMDKIVVWTVRGLGTLKRRIGKLVQKHDILVLVIS